MFSGLESITGFRRFDVFWLRIKYRFPPLVFGYYRCKLGMKVARWLPFRAVLL
jgi:hypothetical protein